MRLKNEYRSFKEINLVEICFAPNPGVFLSL